MKSISKIAPVVLILTLGILPSTAVGASDELEKNKEIVRRNAQAINDRDLGLLEETTATDLLRHCQATPDIQINSLEDFKNFLAADWSTFPDSKITLHQMVAEGDRVAVFATYQGTQTGPMGPFPASGKQMTLDFSGIFRIENGKIAEIWVTWDNLAALSQLGHFPPPKPAG